jgi:hypothetical protein
MGSRLKPSYAWASRRSVRTRLVPVVKLNPNVRNVVIVLLLAAVVDLVPAGGRAANFVEQVIYLSFLAMFAWILVRLYREHRIAIYALGTRDRTVLYSAIGVAILTLTATSRLWNSPAGSIAWIVLLAACIYALVGVYRASRQY